MISPLLLVLCFMFVSSLLLLGVIYSRLHWVLKAGLIALSLAFSALFYHGYVGSLGYPAPVTPPALFRFVYGIVREPMMINNDPGVIYVWLFVEGETQPRAIAVPYSAENRKTVAAAKKAVEAGKTVYMGTGMTGKGEGKGKGEGTGQGGSVNGKAGTNKSSSRGNNTVPYDVQGDELVIKEPPDTVPKKEGSTE